MTRNKLPQIDSIQALAQFWDTHDVTDFDDELEEVDDTVFDREKVVTVHLKAEDAEVVNRLAKAKGVDDAELIREWVAEKVHSL